MNRDELKILQNLSLDIKIAKSKQRIREAIFKYGIDGLYISFSGGKDSTVLKHLVHSVNKDIVVVGCDTGLEYPSVRENMIKNSTTIIKPKIPFTKVIEKYGYPIVSKEQSQFIHQYRTAKSEKTKLTRWNGNKWGRGKISEKWKFLVDTDFKISDKCCDVMKKQPFKKYEKETGRIPILGKMACESSKRLQDYIKQGGCNAFENKRPKSEPIGFWTEQDILEYILTFNLSIPKIYGNIIKNNNTLELTGAKRTGCMFCAYGLHMDKIDRFKELEKSNPKIYNYCMKGGEYKDGYWIPKNGLGMRKVLNTYIDGGDY